MSVSGHTAMTHTLPRPGLVLLPYPDPYRSRFSAEAVLDMLDYQFETTCPPERVAAVFIEPLMSDGGLIGAARGLPQSAGGALPPPRHPHRARRGQGGPGAHGRAARPQPRGAGARHGGPRQGTRRRAAALSADRAGGAHGPQASLRDPDHRRQSGLHRRGPRRAPHHSRRGPPRSRRAHGGEDGGWLPAPRRAARDGRRRARAGAGDRRRPGAEPREPDAGAGELPPPR